MTKPNQPSTRDIATVILAQFASNYAVTSSLLPKSFQFVVAYAVAGVFQNLWQYVGWTSLQMFVETAHFGNVVINGTNVNPLVSWGQLIGVGAPDAARRAELKIDITVSTQSGHLQSGSQLINSATGVIYALKESVVLDSSTVQAEVIAVSDSSGGTGAGEVGNLESGSTLEFVSPYLNIERNANVTATLVTGTDAASEIDYRQKVIDRFKLRAQGGASADYIIWSSTVPTVTNVFPYVGDTPGTVDVYIETTNGSDGIPTPAELLEVKEAIEQKDNGLSYGRPVTALVNVVPITRKGFDVEITGITGVNDSGAVQNAITSTLATYFQRREPYIDGGTIPPRKDTIAQTAIAGIIEDIVTADGGYFESVTVAPSGGPTFTTYQLIDGEMAKIQSIDFV